MQKKKKLKKKKCKNINNKVIFYTFFRLFTKIGSIKNSCYFGTNTMSLKYRTNVCFSSSCSLFLCILILHKRWQYETNIIP
jgi:RNA recognition motif-containing protein